MSKSFKKYRNNFATLAYYPCKMKMDFAEPVGIVLTTATIAEQTRNILVSGVHRGVLAGNSDAVHSPFVDAV